MKVLPLLRAFALLALLSACATKPPPAEAAAHSHRAPHGGTLVELGDHLYNVELVRDRTAGKLTAWIFDAHAENRVRIQSPTIDLIAMPGGQFTRLPLEPVANPATGETIGDTSQFEAQADFLKTAGEFAGIVSVEIKGTRFDKVPYVVSD
jgi:hypothetical protein